jgi:hypothetical protein
MREVPVAAVKVDDRGCIRVPGDPPRGHRRPVARSELEHLVPDPDHRGRPVEHRPGPEDQAVLAEKEPDAESDGDAEWDEYGNEDVRSRTQSSLPATMATFFTPRSLFQTRTSAAASASGPVR